MMGLFVSRDKRDRKFFIVPGQRDNRTISKSCRGMGCDGTVLPRGTKGTENTSLTQDKGTIGQAQNFAIWDELGRDFDISP